MKRIYFLYFTLLSVFLISCKQRVYLTISEPAAVFLEKEYESAGVVNRTYSSGAGKVVDVIENAMTLEGNLDHEGSKAAITGMFDQLTVNQRFKHIVMLDSMTVQNGGMDVFPAPLSWAEVDKICMDNGVQLLFVLEVFDTDTKIDYSTRNVTKSTPLGDVPLLEHTVKMVTKIKTGWRIYDPKNKLIRDEYYLRDQIISRGSGINPVKAASTLMKRGQAVRQVSRQVGRFYAGRVEDQRFRVWREYYNKGSRNLKMAKRRSEVGDWDGAAELWEKDTHSSKRKVAGRACYNMAIYAEINGDVYGALEWAQKAYTDYNIKFAKDYAQLLRNRVRRWEENQRRKEIDNQE
jgi:hypothetical protein